MVFTHIYTQQEKKTHKEKNNNRFAMLSLSLVHRKPSADGLKDRNRKIQREWKESVTH